VLGAAGYQTAGFVANTIVCSYEFGLNRGFSHYEDYPISAEAIIASPTLSEFLITEVRKVVGDHQLVARKSAEQINGAFLRWLAQSQAQQQPFFAFLNYFDAHDPYLPPPEFALRFSPRVPNGALRDVATLSQDEIRELNDAYDGTIAYLDYALEQLLGALEQQGILQNTLVIITSDHGEQFGENGMMGHANSLYLPTLHVPLLMLWPGHVPAGKSIRRYISLRDIPVTVFDLLGLRNDAGFPGRSLATCWGGACDPTVIGDDPLISQVEHLFRVPDWYRNAKGQLRSVMSGGLHYILNEADQREELYDMETDPDESHDLTGSAQWQDRLGVMRQSLKTLVSQA
jgi:arylsulfatase A-like enzyme